MNATSATPCILFSGSAADWWNVAWGYRKKVNFRQHGRGALTNFTILVKQTPLNTEFWSHVRSDGRDVRFIDSDNSTELIMNRKMGLY